MKSELNGIWSNGALNKFYEGSHDFRLTLRSDGQGCFIHDGWWLYSKYFFVRDL